MYRQIFFAFMLCLDIFLLYAFRLCSYYRLWENANGRL